MPGSFIGDDLRVVLQSTNEFGVTAIIEGRAVPGIFRSAGTPVELGDIVVESRDPHLIVQHGSDPCNSVIDQQGRDLFVPHGTRVHIPPSPTIPDGFDGRVDKLTPGGGERATLHLVESR